MWIQCSTCHLHGQPCLLICMCVCQRDLPLCQLDSVGVVGALSRAKPPPRNTLPGEMMAVKQLARDKYIIILPADKGRATVVMNRSDYSAKMQAMLDDRDTYQPLSNTSLESKMNCV